MTKPTKLAALSLCAILLFAQQGAYMTGVYIPGTGGGGGGTGDVVGPNGVLANAIAFFDGLTGKLLKAGTITGNTTEVVTWSGAKTSGNCTEQDASGNLVDSGAPCGTGSGATALCTVSASTSTITFFPDVDADNTCNIRVGNVIHKFDTPMTYVLDGSSAGPDTLRSQVTSAGVFNVLIASGATGTCTGCTDAVGSSYSDTATAVWTWTITDDEFDVGGGTRELAEYGRTIIQCTGATCGYNSGVFEIDVPASTADMSQIDMSYYEVHFLPWLHGDVTDFVPWEIYCESSASGAASDTNTVTAAGEPRGVRYFTGGTPADGDYMTCTWGGDAAAPSGRPRLSDFLGTFKAFTAGKSVRFPSITSVKLRVGFFGNDSDDTPSNFVGFLLDSAVDSNWRLQVCDAGSCSESTSTIAGSTNHMIMLLNATADGTINGSINGTSISHSDAFPTFSTGTNFSIQVRTRTNVSKDFEWYESKIKVMR